MCRLLHSDELLQKYRLTGGVDCEDCGFSFTEDVLGFYFNTEHGQIEDHLIGMIDWYSYSPIRGFVRNEYCKNCNKFISTYYIRNLNDEQLAVLKENKGSYFICGNIREGKK